ncbi:MAG: hypothetical protein LBE56_11720 [Tannerella sp.]|jgi:transcriptional regulator with XRE-family HTH domain|nr:hypothetical protein [Tannerella sp.]
MKTNDLLNNLHVGKMIKQVAEKKKITPQLIVSVLDGRYIKNADKIFRLPDMYSSDIGRISYVLEHNLLEDISKEYLSFIPFSMPPDRKKLFTITLDAYNHKFTLNTFVGKSSDMDVIDVGVYLKALSKQNGCTSKSIANKMGCSENLIKYYYFTKKEMKIKKLIEMSQLFNRNLIAELFLSKMYISPFIEMGDKIEMVITDREIRIFDPRNPDFSLDYTRLENQKKL